jgi:archaellum component FlaF (FlaF/FlaG flagellin family)
MKFNTFIFMKYCILLLFIPFKLFSQDLTGLWTGTLYNDTTQQTLQYEIAISESKGKYTAYSYTTFVLDGKQLRGVKSLKIAKQKDIYFCEDVELLDNNYPVEPPKGVRQISRISLISNDSLSGKFITTRTRQYGHQVTGSISLARKPEVKEDKLIAALDKLGIANTLSFLHRAEETKPLVVVATKPPAPVVAKPTKKKEDAVAPAKKQQADPIVELTKRKVETIETIYFTSDSLKLTLYDNGFVDGDSVSIILNGKVVLEHQRLSTQAITKTIQTPRASIDSLTIIMFAENLGSIAPNTGLLIISDGDKRHEVTFSGDLQKNAAILLKPKR